MQRNFAVNVIMRKQLMISPKQKLITNSSRGFVLYRFVSAAVCTTAYSFLQLNVNSKSLHRTTLKPCWFCKANQKHFSSCFCYLAPSTRHLKHTTCSIECSSWIFLELTLGFASNRATGIDSSGVDI